MADSLDDRVNVIHRAFNDQFPSSNQVSEVSNAWVMEAFEDYVIAHVGDKYFNIPFVEDGEEIAFSGRDGWTEVEEKKEWIEKTKSLLMSSNSLKVLSKTDKELRVGNYMVLFGGKDIHGEHFTKNTDFESAYTQTGMLHVDWEHGQEPEVLHDPVAPNADDVLGFVDWKTAKIDKIGLWAERVLNRRNKYMKYVELLIENGLIGSSSMTTDEGDTKTLGGEIVKWPLYRDTLTVNPAEPRMMTENVVTAIKTLAAINPDLEALLPQEPGEGSSAGATVGDENGADRRAIQRKAIQFLARL
jgi:hypothetical protein